MTATIVGQALYRDDCVKKGKRLGLREGLPVEVVERLDGMFSRVQLEEALTGLSPQEIDSAGWADHGVGGPGR